MGKAKHPKPAKLFVGLLTNEIPLIERAGELLIKKFGEVDLQSDIWDFSYTSYYNNEMGHNLKRKFLSFKKLIALENICTVKLMTNKLEDKFSVEGKRRINIDPGYISLGKLALLTTKDYYHRLYLGKGIYAEVTLYYRGNAFRHFDWSYPDYRSKDYAGFFNILRNNYYSQLESAEPLWPQGQSSLPTED